MKELASQSPRTLDERDTDASRKRDKRRESARIEIPQCVNPKRREKCLEDPERFLRYYLPKKFRQPFGNVHRRLIQAIYDRAMTGGKKAVAAPRSRGKSTIVKGMNIFLTARSMVRFIVPIASTTKLAGRLYQDYRDEWTNNDLLFEDFPEICGPARDLEGAPQRASRQHVNGHLTLINWSKTDFLRLPRVPGDANDYLKSLGEPWSPYGGIKMTFVGLDAAFRGLNIDDDRPDYLIIDDPETRESAKSIDQVNDRTEVIKKDIEGLEGQEKPVAMVMVTTLQNTFSLSATFTDPEKEPAWEGERYGWVEQWPDRMDLWDDYIAKRKAGQASGDRHGMDAVKFYLENADAMNAGAKMLADNYKPITNKYGEQVVYSAIQEAFNKISDTNMQAFKAEYQNDPEEVGEDFRSKIEAHTVIGCEADFDRFSAASDTQIVVAGVDVRKTELHYARLASGESIKHQLSDYDVRSHGTSETTVEQAEQLILDGLNVLDEIWAETPLIDDNGSPRTLDLVLIDKGWLGNWKEDGQRKTWASQPVETFCLSKDLRRYIPAKGAPNYQSPAPSRDVIIGDNWHINRGKGQARKCSEVIWNAEHWHSLVEDLFSSNDEGEKIQLFVATDGVHKGHDRLSHHIREGADELLELRKKGTASRKSKYRRDHWWDAIAMALVARSVEFALRERQANRRKPMTLAEMAARKK